MVNLAVLFSTHRKRQAAMFESSKTGLCWLLEAFEVSKDCFVCILPDIELVLSDSNFVFSSIGLPVLEDVFASKSVGKTNVTEEKFIFSSSSRSVLFTKVSF